MVEFSRHKIQCPHVAALVRGGQQRFSLLDRGGGVLVAERLDKSVLGRSELGKRVEKSPPPSAMRHPLRRPPEAASRRPDAWRA
jgi:hypothetical protein